VGDPGAYLVPDVACDLTQVTIEQAGDDRVRVSSVRGLPPTSTYKVTATYVDGWRNEAALVIAGQQAGLKARATADALFERTRRMLAKRGLGDYSETMVEVLGDEAQYGDANRTTPLDDCPREVVLKISAKHPERAALELFAREFAPAATSMSPGTMSFVGGRPSPSPLVRVYNFLLPKGEVQCLLATGEQTIDDATPLALETTGGFVQSASVALEPPPPLETTPTADGPGVRQVRLIELCYGRSGDKGDTANIGLIARRAEILPFVRAVVTEEVVRAHFAHALSPAGTVTRYDVPGIHAMNFVLTGALGGGGTSSLRTDCLAKAFAQQLLAMEVMAPVELLSSDTDS